VTAKETAIRGGPPFLALVGASVLVLLLTRKYSEPLTTWSAEPQLAWNAAALGAFVLTALLLLRTYAQLRNPRLAALACLLVPLGCVHFFHHSTPVAQRVAVEDGGKLRILKEGESAPARPATADAASPISFIGLPDSVAKRYPELPKTLSRVFATLYSLGFLAVPLIVLAASVFPSNLTSRRLRLLILLFLLAEGVLAGLAVSLGPDDLRHTPQAPALLMALTGAALVVAFVFWRSAAGIGGAVAGIVLFLLPAGLSASGVDPTQLGFDLKRLPSESERILVMAFPVALLVAVGREWIVSMKHTTQTDALTKIFNKAYAESILAGTSGLELGSLYSVALLDIDHFKKVNDTHGHGAGDVVLREVCKTIWKTTQNRGLVCRTGGEEITVFFPGLTADKAQEICEEIRLAVQELEIETTDNNGKKVTLTVTISLGLATNKNVESGASVHGGVRDVVEAADRAVYEAKDSGRNRVVLD
jgi:diguanylate cyclase (GGDEF)-like protein